MVSQPLKRILLVEDDPDIQMITSLALGSLGGYTVHACGSESEAVAAAAAFNPDLILLDMIMPGTDGVQILEALRHVQATAATPVIFLTARVRPADVERYRDVNSLAVISKPFDPTDLVERIHMIWARFHGEPA